MVQKRDIRLERLVDLITNGKKIKIPYSEFTPYKLSPKDRRNKYRKESRIIEKMPQSWIIDNCFEFNEHFEPWNKNVRFWPKHIIDRKLEEKERSVLMRNARKRKV